MAETPRSDPLSLVGVQLLGRYTLRARLASGGMSVVYRADDDRLQRPVCVKVFFGIDPDQPDYRTHYEHFVQEVFALSQLSHPNTLRIYDFGYLEQAPKAPFYVSELLEGGTFLQRVRRDGSQSPVEMLEVLGPIVQALSEAHARGVIHRDIKPSNILFAAPPGGIGRPVPKLADFGIAKAEGAKLPNRAGDTRVMGGRISLFSPGWAAPEQMRAEPVSPQTDVFSLGLVLAFGLAGRKVFPDRAQHVAYSARDGADDVIEEALEALALPFAFHRVCLRACRAKASERFATPAAFLAALEEAVREPVTNPDVRTDTQSVPLGETTDKQLPRARSEGPQEDRKGQTTGSPKLTRFRLERLEPGELVAGGRRIRIVPTSGSLDIGGPEGPLEPKFRLTFLEGGEKGRLHIRGLSCFVTREGARPSSATEISRSTKLELLGADLRRLGELDIVFGRLSSAGEVLFPLSEGELALPPGSVLEAALLHFGPEAESWLVYTAARAEPAPAA